MTIHPLAVVDPAAQIGPDVRIGPFCVVESDVTIGEGCILESNAVIKSGTKMGENNHVFEGAVIGGLPQHVNMPPRTGKLIIGSGNTFREYVTVHRAMEEDHATIIGNDNLLMVNAHVAHDCRLGNMVIATNNIMLAGHVTVDDRAYISGAVAVHQFCRIGTLAMVGGQAHVNKDVPPYVTVDGLSSYVVGLNYVGLRRAGFDQKDTRQLKDAYRVIYRSGLPWKELLARLQAEFPHGPADHFYSFLASTARGITPERRLPPGATIKLHRESEEEPQVRAKAG